MRDIPEYNRAAWNRRSASGCRWCRPVAAEVIERAKRDDWAVILTP